jgi:hypothetical protein
MRILHQPVPATSHIGVDAALPVLHTILVPVPASPVRRSDARP